MLLTVVVVVVVAVLRFAQERFIPLALIGGEDVIFEQLADPAHQLPSYERELRARRPSALPFGRQNCR